MKSLDNYLGPKSMGNLGIQDFVIALLELVTNLIDAYLYAALHAGGLVRLFTQPVPLEYLGERWISHILSPGIGQTINN